MRKTNIALLVVAAGVLAACQSSISASESYTFQERADYLVTELDKAIDRAGQGPDASKRVDELQRLGRLANQLGGERLAGYMSYVANDMVRFRAAQTELGKIEAQLPAK